MKKKYISLMAILLLCGCGNNGNNFSAEKESSSELSNSIVSEPSFSSENSQSSLVGEYSKDINDYYDGYYSSIRSWDNGDDLFNQLHDLISSDIAYQTYNANWEVNKKADQDQYNFDMVDQIYSSSPILKTSTYYSGTGWQKEHAFCQSLMGHYIGDRTPKVVFSETYALKSITISEDKFVLTFHDNRVHESNNLTTSEATLSIGGGHLIVNSKDYGLVEDKTLSLNNDGNVYLGNENLGTPTSVSVSYVGEDKSMVSDFHNIFASFSSGNASRGNKNLGEAKVEDYDDGYDSDTKIFEPGIKDKGIVARAILYMVTCYDELNLKDGYVSIEDVMIDGFGSHGRKEDILSWASSIKVDYQEYQHNLEVYKVQTNRNPYVDFPELVDYVFGNKKDQAGTIEDVLDTSTQHLLKTDKKEFKNVAVEGVKYNYEVGEKISVSDIENIYKVYTDLSCEKEVNLSNYSLNIEGYTFTEKDIGKKTILLMNESSDVCLTYGIEITSKDPSVNAENKFSYLNDDGSANSALIKNISSNNPIIINHNGTDFIYTIAAGGRGNGTREKGICFGTTTAPVGTLTIESKEKTTWGNLTKIKGVYINSSCSSSGSYRISVYIDNELVKEMLCSNSSSQRFDFELNNSKEGKLKIVFSNITKGLYLKDISIDFE